MKCKKCGNHIPNGEIECPSCHTAIALMSQIKSEEDKQAIALEQQDEIVIEPENNKQESVDVTPVSEPLDIRFEADVLKETGESSPVEDPVLTNNQVEIDPVSPMQPIAMVEESVDAEEVKKAMAQYSPSTPKDIKFFLPIILGVLALIGIVIGIIYGIGTLL